jgi:hypothetical protein
VKSAKKSAAKQILRESSPMKIESLIVEDKTIEIIREETPLKIKAGKSTNGKKAQAAKESPKK